MTEDAAQNRAYLDRFAAEHPEEIARARAEIAAAAEGLVWSSDWGRYTRDTCPDRPHRGPQGPNEDLSQCPYCWSISYAMRPDGEEYGGHLADCSLPRRHESYCQPGGSGHPAPRLVRGYWPEDPS